MLDYRKLIRIGIDRIVLYNFEVLRSPPKTTVVSENEISEKLILREDTFSLTDVTTLKKNGDLTNFKRMTLNPNKILHGHNIYNSTPEDLELALKKLNDLLELKGVKIDFSNSKIYEIEINFNFILDIEDYKEIFTLLFINQKDNIRYEKGKPNKKFSDIYKTNTFRGQYYKKDNLIKQVQVYNKEEEFKKRNKLKINHKITRLEWLFKCDEYVKLTSINNLDINLKSLINNFNVIEKIFLDETKKELFEKGYRYAQENIKKNLEEDYKKFKKINKFAKEKGVTRKWNVYKYLESETWIFDYLYLIDLVKEHDKPHFSREKERILKKYKHHNGEEKLEEIYSLLFNHFSQKMVK